MKSFEQKCAIPLDSNTIRQHLNSPSTPIELFESLGSTNDYLKESGNTLRVCLAESQTAGRGRLERPWHSPFGKNIYCSMRFPLTKKAHELSGLSLVVGLAICEAIEKIHPLPTPAQVKWPNDILIDDKKIAGTLIEINKDALIIGIGVNINMSEADINQPWTSLQKLTGVDHDRNFLCAQLINHVTQYVGEFIKSDLSNFEKKWQTRDYLLGKEITLTCTNEKFTGVGSGINQHGHLVLTLPDGTNRAFLSGESTLLKQSNSILKKK